VEATALTTGVFAGTMARPDPSDPAAGTAFCGVSAGGAGVYGVTLGGIGVHGIIKSGAALAGLFEGDVVAAGSISRFASLFQIDHPLDPDNKALRHLPSLSGAEQREGGA
jgi:hypothetical protein